MLRDIQIKALKPKDKVYRIADFSGLSIEVQPSGSKFWRYRYRFDSKASMMSLGKYPKVSLSQARLLRDAARALLDDGINPVVSKKRAKEVVTHKTYSFADVFDLWFTHNLDKWSDKTEVRVYARIHKHLLPFIGDVEINQIKPMDLIVVFKRIEETGHLHTASKIRSFASRIFRYGVGMGYCDRDPVRDLPSDIFKKEKRNAMAHTTDPVKLGGILRVLGDYKGHYSVCFALKIMPYVFLRPAELVGLQWCDVDFDRKIITIAAEKMKMRKEHLVPICKQVFNLLQDLKKYNRDSDFLFPSPRTNARSINAETLRAGLRRSGINKEEFTSHGFRHTASTLLHEQGWLSDAVERQLSHVDGGVRGVYNKALHLEVRVEMMQAWADYLDSLK